jgi:NDP-sugar pyrophosphorylase family protein
MEAACVAARGLAANARVFSIVIAIILIGGFGTRLRPLTLKQPKALMPVLNRPFLSYQLDILKEAGVTDVVLAAGQHSKPWSAALRRVCPPRLRMHFAFEPAPLGTAGAIRFAYDTLKKKNKTINGPILVFNGDVFFNLPVREFVAFHKDNGSQATVALTPVEDPSRFGVVELDGRGAVHAFIEKPKGPVSTNLINAGAYLLNAEWIEKIPTGRSVSIEKESFPQSLERGDPMFGFKMSGYWNDIGTHASYLQAHLDLLSPTNSWTQISLFRKRAPSHDSSFLKGRASKIHSSVVMEGAVCIGDRVVVGKNARLKNCVVLSDVRIDENAVINGAIIGPRTTIGRHVEVSEGRVLGERSNLSPYSRI